MSGENIPAETGDDADETVKSNLILRGIVTTLKSGAKVEVNVTEGGGAYIVFRNAEGTETPVLLSADAISAVIYLWTNLTCGRLK